MSEQALVVGGKGRMGRWFCSFLASAGREVSTFDPAGATPGFARVRDLGQAVREMEADDACIVCTPMEAAPGALKTIREAGTPALVVDVCSIKDPIAVELRKAAKAGIKVASLHPMWGPDAVVLSDKNLLVLDCGSAAAAREAKALFRGTAVRIHDVPLERHDKLMAWALALPHALNLAVALALARSGMDPEELERLGGPTLRDQLAVARAVSVENKDLYHGIQSLNPDAPLVHAELERALKRVVRARSSRLDFALLMAECERYFAGKPTPRPRRRRYVP